MSESGQNERLKPGSRHPQPLHTVSHRPTDGHPTPGGCRGLGPPTPTPTGCCTPSAAGQSFYPPTRGKKLLRRKLGGRPPRGDAVPGGGCARCVLPSPGRPAGRVRVRGGAGRRGPAPLMSAGTGEERREGRDGERPPVFRVRRGNARRPPAAARCPAPRHALAGRAAATPGALRGGPAPPFSLPPPSPRSAPAPAHCSPGAAALAPGPLPAAAGALDAGGCRRLAGTRGARRRRGQRLPRPAGRRGRR